MRITGKVRIVLVTVAFIVFFSTFVNSQSQSVQQYYEAGVAKLQNGDYYNAVSDFNNALRLNSGFKDARIGLGNAYLKSGAFDEALLIFTEVAKKYPQDESAQVGIGYALVAMGQYDKSLRQFEHVVSLFPQNVEAHYGIAYVYYLMNYKVWAMRRIDTIMKINPLHYETIVLIAMIKSEEERFDDAEDFLKKAVSIRENSSAPYVELGLLMLRIFLKNGDDDYLDDAAEDFRRALSINNHDIRARRYLGYIQYYRHNYTGAIEELLIAANSAARDTVLYHDLGIVQSAGNDKEGALKSLEKAYALSPNDIINLSKLEDFLCESGFSTNHAARIAYSKKRMKSSEDLSRLNFADAALFNLRRAVYLYPLYREAREELCSYYRTMDYDRFVIDELKRMQQLFQGDRYTELLDLAVIKRREKMYFVEGYALEIPVRDVPKLIVANLANQGGLGVRLLSGETIADSISFALGQYGRQQPIDQIERKKYFRDQNPFFNRPEDILMKSDSGKNPEFLLYGTCNENGNSISLDMKLLELKRGIVVHSFQIREKGKDALVNAALRSAREVYTSIPFSGRVLKVNDDGLVINLGRFDGVNVGDYVCIDGEVESGIRGRFSIRRKMIFQISESDTIVAKARPMRISDLGLVTDDMIVRPLAKRRAKLIE